jgi:type IV pilus assembly protein PilA
MFDRIKTRLSSEEGFTLIELLVVIVILGILIAIAVPAYLSLTGSAHNAAAESNVRSAIPAAETIYEQNGDYSSITPAALQAVAPGVKVDNAVSEASGAGYCLDASSGTTSFYYAGGNWTPTTGVLGTITAGTCAADVS